MPHALSVSTVLLMSVGGSFRLLPLKGGPQVFPVLGETPDSGNSMRVLAYMVEIFCIRFTNFLCYFDLKNIYIYIH